MAFAMTDFDEEDYREKKVKGIVTDGKRFDECSVVVRRTDVIFNRKRFNYDSNFS